MDWVFKYRSLRIVFEGLKKAIKWLTIEAIVVRATTAADSTSPVLPLAK
jgi:hypothetical protein